MRAEIGRETRTVTRRTWVPTGLGLVMILLGVGETSAQRGDMPAGYPKTLETDLQRLLERVREGPRTSELLVQVSSTYFDMADDLLTDEGKRRAAYDAGAKAAEEAFTLDETNADAHFFHAVNVGSAERLRGVAKAALVVKEIKACAERAVQLNPYHAPALQMLGGMLIELPWFMGGDDKKAQVYLERAVAADGNYTHARILLAKLYRKQGRTADARQQLEAVIHTDRPHYRYTWEREYRPEAERLLQQLTQSLVP